MQSRLSLFSLGVLSLICDYDPTAPQRSGEFSATRVFRGLPEPCLLHFFCRLESSEDEDFRGELDKDDRAWALQIVHEACLHTTLIALRDLHDFLKPQRFLVLQLEPQRERTLYFSVEMLRASENDAAHQRKNRARANCRKVKSCTFLNGEHPPPSSRWAEVPVGFTLGAGYACLWGILNVAED